MQEVLINRNLFLSLAKAVLLGTIEQDIETACFYGTGY